MGDSEFLKERGLLKEQISTFLIGIKKPLVCDFCGHDNLEIIVDPPGAELNAIPATISDHPFNILKAYYLICSNCSRVHGFTYNAFEEWRRVKNDDGDK